MTRRPARLSEAEALLRIARAIGTLDLEVVVSKAAGSSASALGAARAVLFLLSPDGRQLELVTSTAVGLPRRSWPIEDVGPITRRVLRTGRPVAVRDYLAVRGRVRSIPPIAMRSFVAVPVQVGSERLGALLIGEVRRHRVFTRREVELARGIGNLIGVAVKNARLAGDAASRLDLLRGLSARLFTVQEDERRRIARELHDEAGQALTAMKLNLDLARRELPPGPAGERLAEVSRLAHEVLEELRRIARDLRPRALDELGLVPALKVLVDTFRDRAGVDMEVALDSEIDLDGDAASTAFRFVQEALTNVVLHARASRVLVRAAAGDDSVVFSISDDGIGFDMEKTRGLGLVGMKERAALVQGKVALQSSLGRGTSVALVLPTRRQEMEL